jgi:protein-tyrosine-phosphatase
MRVAVDDETPDRVPTVLFACVHNSGRSVAAKLLAHRYGAGRVLVCSAGSEPAASLDEGVVAVLAEAGISAVDEVPTLLSADLVGGADVVVTMGCGESCPVFAGKHYLDWPVDDPAGRDRESVRRIVEEIDRRVRELLIEIGIDVDTQARAVGGAPPS